MIHDNESSNHSGNRPFEDILGTRMSRRNLLACGTILSATGFLPALAGNKALVQSASAAIAQGARDSVPQSATAAIAQGSNLINFPVVPVADGSGPVPNISSAYQQHNSATVSPLRVLPTLGRNLTPASIFLTPITLTKKTASAGYSKSIR